MKVGFKRHGPLQVKDKENNTYAVQKKLNVFYVVRKHLFGQMLHKEKL